MHLVANLIYLYELCCDITERSCFAAVIIIGILPNMPHSNVVILVKCNMVAMMEIIYHPGFTFRLPRAMDKLNCEYETFISNYNFFTSSDSKRKYGKQKDTG
jgi:hypothetical protein